MDISHSNSKTAIFGDVGGHWKPFVNGLASIGVDVKHRVIPAGLTVVQLGDLVHKGPSSNELIILADEMMQQNNSDPSRGKWVQLMGNHESQYFLGAPRFWAMQCSGQSIATLNRWWQNKDILLHHVVDQDSGKPFVISHAGISHRLFFHAESIWNAVGTNNSPDYGANLRERTLAGFNTWLESLQPERMDIVAQPGAMLTGKISRNAGLVWAESIREVYSTWRSEENIPFHQVHGHSAPFTWSRSKFYPSVPEIYRKEIVLDKRARHSFWANTDETLFIGVDPGFDRSADRDIITPLVINSSGIVNE